MNRNLPPLKERLLADRASFSHPAQHPPSRVTGDRPAWKVKTRQAHVAPATGYAPETTDEAERQSIQRGMGLLWVVDREQAITGVMPMAGVMGEKPLHIAPLLETHARTSWPFP